ncbi:GINS complex subunit 3, partial [Tremellales sp. Uapishka_1]
MDDDYFSLSSILAENHKLDCTFTLPVRGLGYLEGGTEPDIQENAKVQLPMWLASTLSLNEFTTFPIPAPYSYRVKSALKASAPSVKLGNLVGGNGWWYKWGEKIASVLDDEPQLELLSMLLRTFANRLPSLQDLSAHHASSDHSGSEAGASSGETFKEGMEGEERELFAIGQESGRMTKKWYDTSRK